MQIFVARNGLREGPYTADQVSGRLADGSLSITDLYWHEGLPNWVPLSGLAPASEVATPPAATPVAQTTTAPDIPDPGSGPQIRPWVRYGARMLDIYLFSYVVGISIGVLAPGFAVARLGIIANLLAIGLWCFFEPIFLATCGATPGKALLCVRVLDADGARLDYLSGLTRAFRVWISGMGLGVPLVSLFTLLVSYDRLTKQGITNWDKACGCRVVHREPAAWRVWALALLITLFVASTIYYRLRAIT